MTILQKYSCIPRIFLSCLILFLIIGSCTITVVPLYACSDQNIPVSSAHTSSLAFSETAREPDATTDANTAALTLSSSSVLLMEASTGTILYETDSKKELRPASITKIMTLLLIFEALEKKQLTLQDTITVSEYAASMGGSQVFLEPNEIQTVDTMIKCISIASANDACVAMAEAISGSEEEFVKKMNDKAASLGMEHTNFVNCCGLDVDNHYSCAYDIALMSRELITKYPQIHNYSTIWMEDITHTTKKGTTPFTLTNTNKLIRQYEYATGLKTGSTSLAKYCVSATALKNNMELIAVVMAAPDYKIRFADARALLEYGYANYQLYTDTHTKSLKPLPVTKSISTEVPLAYADDFHCLTSTTIQSSDITVTYELPESVTAPVKKGDVAGSAIYSSDGKELGRCKILYAASIPESHFKDYFLSVFRKWAE